MNRLLKLVVLFVPGLLLILSILTLITTSPIGSENIPLIDNFAFKQTIFALIGFVIFLVLTRVDLDYFKHSLPVLILYTVAVFLLLFVLVLPRSIANTHRWFVVGPFTIQPSELIKPVIYIVLAYILSSKQKLSKKFLYLAGAMFIPLILIFIEPDAGTFIFLSIVIFIVSFVYFSKYKDFLYGSLFFIFEFVLFLIFCLMQIKVFCVIPIIAIIYLFFRQRNVALISVILLFATGLIIGGSVMAWKFNILKPYQKQRVQPFIESYKKMGIKGLFTGESEPNPHVRQAQIAMGSAGIKGKGLWQGTQSRLSFLPEYTTDFIYAAFSEEFGVLGGLLLVLLYVILLASIFLVALAQEQEFNFILILAIGVGLGFQIIINLGMNLGVLPTKGMPLPFLSYGGSSIISAFIQLSFVYSATKTMKLRQ